MAMAENDRAWMKQSSQRKRDFPLSFLHPANESSRDRSLPTYLIPLGIFSVRAVGGASNFPEKLMHTSSFLVNPVSISGIFVSDSSHGRIGQGMRKLLSCSDIRGNFQYFGAKSVPVIHKDHKYRVSQVSSAK